MIIAKIRGGLGNQMFQYAFGKALAKRRDIGLWLDLTNYDAVGGNRVFSLDAFNVSYTLSLKGSVARRLIGYIPPHFIRKEDGTHIFQEDDGQGSFLFTVGFWESYRYLEPVATDLRKEFTLRKPSDEFQRIFSAIKKSESISIHIRRGDYLIPHGKYLQNISYYHEAVSSIRTPTLEHPSIFVFSDDTAWCKDNLSRIDGIETTIIESHGLSDTEELLLMSQCDHNVISNSTFSWWAAYLNENPQKNIVAPKQWFTDSHLNDIQIENLMLPSWTLL